MSLELKILCTKQGQTHRQRLSQKALPCVFLCDLRIMDKITKKLNLEAHK